MTIRRMLLFSDLDGTFLDETYRCPLPQSVLDRLLARQDIEVIFASSRTAAEMVEVQRSINIEGVFIGETWIAENGALISTLNKKLAAHLSGAVEEDGRFISALAEPVEKTLPEVKQIAAACGVALTLFNEMTLTQIASRSGYGLDAAARASVRQCSVLLADLADTPATHFFLNRLRSAGYSTSFGGRWLTVLKGKNKEAVDKGAAIKKMLSAVRAAFNTEPETVGIGNEDNDASMLRATGKKFVINNPRTGHAPSLAALEGAVLLQTVGAAGWREMIEHDMLNLKYEA